MENITSTNQLIEAIRLVEIEKKQEELLFKEQFKITFESLKPANLIKSTIKDLITTPNLNTNILNTVLSVAAGYASKKIAVGDTKSPIKQILGSLLQMGVTSMVSNKGEGVISGIMNVIKHIPFNKHDNK